VLDLSDLPVIDDHAHMFGPDAKDANPVRSFTMLEHPKDIEHQLLYHCAARALAKLYGCAPNEEEIFKLRKAKAENNFEEFVADIFQKANIEALIVDPGYPPTITVEEFQDIVPVKVYSVQRIDEHLFDDVMEESNTFDDLLDTFHEQLDQWFKKKDVVGLKTITAYITGLNIPKIERDHAAEIFKEFQKDKKRWIVEFGFGQKHYIGPFEMRIFLFWEALAKCAENKVPFQIHTGDGDMDMKDMKEASALLLQKSVLNDELAKQVELILVHSSYPEVEFASYLSYVYTNVHIDLSHLNPFLNVLVSRKIEEAFMWTPFSRILYGTDAYGIPEFYWFGVMNFKKELERVLGYLVARDALDEDYAYKAAGMILSENAKKLYSL